MANTILLKLEQSHWASHNELNFLLNSDESHDTLLATADRTRKRYVGDGVHLRAIIEFSNYCRCFCSYCGLHALNSSVERYRMSEESIIATANEIHQAGYRTIVLQCGEDLFFTKERMASIIKKIKHFFPTIALTISIGERPFEDYQAIKAAGADRFLIKHEISDPLLYRQLHNGDELADRIAATKSLIDLGFQTGGGLMVGLKGQTTQTIASDLLLIKELGLNMVSVGPFISHPQTDLADSPNGNLTTVLRAVALARLLCPYALIPSTSAFIALTGKPNLMLEAGANVLMQKAEPVANQKMYEIYPKAEDNRTISEKRVAISQLIIGMGRFVSTDRGDYPGEKNDDKPRNL